VSPLLRGRIGLDTKKLFLKRNDPMAMNRTICAFSILILLCLPTNLYADVIDGGFNEASINVGASCTIPTIFSVSNSETFGSWTANAAVDCGYMEYASSSVIVEAGTARLTAQPASWYALATASLFGILDVPQGAPATLSFDLTEAYNDPFPPWQDSGVFATLSVGSTTTNLTGGGGGHFSIPLQAGPNAIQFYTHAYGSFGNYGYVSETLSITNFGITIPEPGTLTLLVSALLGLGAFYLRRHRAKA
jgi:hypothetical protein